MKKHIFALALSFTLALTGALLPLGATATPATATFGQPEVDEAARAYVAAFAEAAQASISAGQLVQALAARELNAQSCLASRAQRLLGQELTTQSYEGLLVGSVSPDVVLAYRQLAQGNTLRANALEVFSCDHAGLKAGISVIR